MVQLAVAEREKTAQELAKLERELREQTSLFQDAKKKESIENKLLEMGGGISNNSLSWPVPFKAVTAYFHDADYPYKHIIGEHSGIDLRASQGTPIKAPSAGYVARVYDAGMGYSYLMVIHTNGISTLYGHVSRFNVIEDQYVQEGQIIGYTGGTPGTAGAGPFCTGPHLHFEVRLNGIPVNPLEYLKIKNIF
ncbi:M23 family metallopeptidase, partial [Candidatus Pacearchaeota archaeon]|nr:M23 family metallopeptidase [Candidatus Pacearchaeota archaeon]